MCEPASVVIHDEGGSTAVRFRHFVSMRNRRRFADEVARDLGVLRRTPRARGAPDDSGSATAQAVATVRSSDSRRRPASVRRDGGGAGRTAVDEVEALRIELRHLADDVALKEEYIAFLGSALDGARRSLDLAQRPGTARCAAGWRGCVRRNPRAAARRSSLEGTNRRAHLTMTPITHRGER